ncbi:MAG: V-type ATP synthase subunit F [bacterium]|nr:V-type ATP synthase subunit F [bacterium]
MYKILAIMESKAIDGFMLTGIEVINTKSRKESEQLLSENLGKGKYGIIIIEEDLYEDLSLSLKKVIEKGDLPVVIPLPLNMEWREKDHLFKSNYISQLLRKTIGYEIKIN